MKVHSGPYTCQDEKGNAVQCLNWVEWSKCRCEAKRNVQGNVGSKNEDRQPKETEWLQQFTTVRFDFCIVLNRARTTSERNVPSSTTWVATRALASNAQKRAATEPA